MTRTSLEFQKLTDTRFIGDKVYLTIISNPDMLYDMPTTTVVVTNVLLKDYLNFREAPKYHIKWVKKPDDTVYTPVEIDGFKIKRNLFYWINPKVWVRLLRGYPKNIEMKHLL